MAYYCFVRLVQPATIVEIGSGFSTLVALEAAERNGFGAVHCIEPFPREFLRNDPRVILHEMKAQDIQPQFLNDVLRLFGNCRGDLAGNHNLLGVTAAPPQQVGVASTPITGNPKEPVLLDNDIFFVDSTHTVKTGSDCLHIFLRLLPEIKRDIYVHIHDVFLPFGMPKEWLLSQQIFWTEQYLLLAFLIDNPKASVLYGSTYNAKWNSPLMRELMNGKCMFGGGSLWFKYNGSLTG